MAKGGKKHGVGEYIVIALILAVITYVEYYIVEFPLAWLGSGWTLFWLIALSVLKFWMVIWYFMHLKEDDRLYTSFFSSGLVIGMGTFVVLALLFLLPQAVAPVVEARGGEVHAAAGYPSKELPAAVAENITSDGASRPLAEQAAAPRPADQSLQVTPPAAPDDGFAVALGDLTGAVVEEAAVEEAVVEEAVVEETVVEEAVVEETVVEETVVEEAVVEEAAVEEAAAAVEPVADEPVAAAPAPAPAPTPAAPAPVSADVTLAVLPGQALYGRCMGCHGATGAGIPGIFPPIAGHVGDILMTDGGREYLIDVLLYGLQGPIEVRGNAYNGLMPGWASMSDNELADLIDYLVLGFDGVPAPAGYQPIAPAEVAAQRGQNLSAAQVLGLRNALGPIQPAPPAEEERPAAAEPEAAAPVSVTLEWDRNLGQQTYTASCTSCHQPTGLGIPGIFPAVAGHAGDLYAAEGGRSYLIDVLLYGLMGPITVGGTTYNGLMPGWASFSDEQVAAVINHIVAGLADAPEGFTPITAGEVAAERGQNLSAAQVYERRATLNLE